MAKVPSTIAMQPSAVPKSVIQPQNAYPREHFPARADNQAQENARATTAQVRANPFANGVLLGGVLFVNGDGIQLSHRLGRPYQGFYLVNVSDLSDGVPTAAISSAPNPAPQAFIILGAQGTFTADVWVY
jgi:hypothetical protein